MPATLQASPSEDVDEHCAVLGPVDSAREEDYWRRAFWCEHYYRQGLDYEDYAPAYCVGYIGCAQYGGEYEDAENSLCANWERIKGDSRLTLAEARRAMRAAWDRMSDRGEASPARLRTPALFAGAPAAGAAPG